MADNSYSLSKIHLPENKKLTGILQKLSLLISLLVLAFGLINLFFSPVIATVFILASIPLFIEGKLEHPFQSKSKTPELIKISFLSISFICSILIILAGILFLFGVGVNYVKQIDLSIGLSFLLIGISLVLPRAKSSFRFHVIHLFAFIILAINSMAILGYLYLQLSPIKINVPYTPLLLAIIFVLLCLAILLRSPARGLMAMFTTDSISSMFAFELLIVNIIIIFILGFLSLVGVRMGVYASYEATAVLIMLIIVFAILFAWFNIRLLYRFELERFVMKEELRVHNIDLKLGNEELAGKMTKLQEKAKEYADKLSNQEKYKDITDNLE
jgi:hypothetical protein